MSTTHHPPRIAAVQAVLVIALRGPPQNRLIEVPTAADHVGDSLVIV